MQQTLQEANDSVPDSRDGRLVLRNTMYLGIAEVLVMPISVVLNAMVGRYLGPTDLGHIYFATTITGTAMLLVGWGHGGPLPAAIALDRSSAGKLLGTSLLWRLVASLLAYGILAGGCYAFGFRGAQQWAIGLVFLASAIGGITGVCQDAIRGFERTDVAAYTRVGGQLVATMLMVPALLAGGGMRTALLTQSISGLIVLTAVMRALQPIGIGKLAWSRALFKELMVAGTPFVFFQLVLVLQPNVDAFYLAKLTPANVVGWYAVLVRLIGCLLIPATALIGALYPTLCRLHATDMPGFGRTTRQALGTVSLVVVPAAFGCALYPDIGVSIFGREAFRPAEDTVRVFAVDLFLVYFSMPIGAALIAAGRQRIWTIVQLVCVGNSALLDPFLIRYFQTSTGNGGTGLPVTAAISESLMVTAGIVLMPKGVFDRSLAKTLLLSLLSGGAMAGAALALRGLHGLPSLLAAPVAVTAYAIALYFTGAISREQIAALQDFVRRKLKRKKPALS